MPKKWKLELWWEFNRRGLKTKFKDPLNKRNAIRLTRMKVVFYQHHAWKNLVYLKFWFTGGMETKLKGRDIDEVYGFIHRLPNTGITEYSVDQQERVMIIPDCVVKGSSNSWYESMVCAVDRVTKDKYGITAIPGKPHVYGDFEEFTKALFKQTLPK